MVARTERQHRHHRHEAGDTLRHAIRQGARAAVAIIALGSLTACGHGDTQAAAAPSALQSQAPSPEPTPTLPDTDTDFGEGAVPDPLPSPSNDSTSAAAALALATKAMTAFARPQVSAQQWFADLSPFLSNQAHLAYANTDPANVSAHRVTGAATLAPSTSGYLASAEVPTDVGTWTLLLTRPGQNAPWAVERFTPPAGIH